MSRTTFTKSIVIFSLLAMTAWLWLNPTSNHTAPDVAFKTITDQFSYHSGRLDRHA